MEQTRTDDADVTNLRVMRRRSVPASSDQRDARCERATARLHDG
jgi:hypothetical protein